MLTSLGQHLATINDENKSKGLPPINIPAGRRAFLKTASAAAALGAGALGAASTAQAQSVNLDSSILNFALNLEYLEGEYYLRGVFGHGLPDNETTGAGGTPGTVVGGTKVPFANNLVADLVNEIAQDEEAHVKFLRATLGAQAVARPTINFTDAFNAAARAAKLIGPNDSFNPFADDLSFVLGGLLLTDVGVTAYNGAAALITSKDFLSAAAGILATEAYHSATLRTLAFQNGLFDQTRRIANVRATLSSDNDDQGVSSDQSTLAGGFRSSANIVATDANGIAFKRTPRQVLNVVYESQNVNAGGFFPFGVNPGSGPSIFG